MNIKLSDRFTCGYTKGELWQTEIKKVASTVKCEMVLPEDIEVRTTHPNQLYFVHEYYGPIGETHLSYSSDITSNSHCYYSYQPAIYAAWLVKSIISKAGNNIPTLRTDKGVASFCDNYPTLQSYYMYILQPSIEDELLRLVYIRNTYGGIIDRVN